MSRLGALIPHKHVRFCESLLGLAGYIRGVLDTESMTIDGLYTFLHSPQSTWLVKPDFTEVILALDILLILKQIELTGENHIQRVMP
jgi:hypothetical protein